MIFTGDKGVRFELEFRDYTDVNGIATDNGALDVSGATEITFLFQKPDGTAATAKKKNATTNEVAFTNTGTDGKAYYDSETGYLSQAGEWQLQGKVQLSTGAIHYSEIVKFRTEQPLG